MLDSTVVNVALARIGEDLGAGFTTLQWISNAYTLTLASFILVGGVLGDRYGRRRVFVIGTVWFGLASAACAPAPDGRAAGGRAGAAGRRWRPARAGQPGDHLGDVRTDRSRAGDRRLVGPRWGRGSPRPVPRGLAGHRGLAPGVPDQSAGGRRGDADRRAARPRDRPRRRRRAARPCRHVCIVGALSTTTYALTTPVQPAGRPPWSWWLRWPWPCGSRSCWSSAAAPPAGPAVVVRQPGVRCRQPRDRLDVRGTCRLLLPGRPPAAAGRGLVAGGGRHRDPAGHGADAAAVRPRGRAVRSGSVRVP